ncbi:hypothetical protein Tco_1264329 [Tanacetum coccineum]
MHNNIMAAGSRDLSNYCHKGPYTPTIVTTPVVPVIENSPAVPEQTTVETVMNMTPENRAHFESEKEAIHLILTGIRDEIYSTVDACQTTQEMWEAIKRLQQESQTCFKDSRNHKENILQCKQGQKGVHNFNRDNLTGYRHDEEIDEQELKAHTRVTWQRSQEVLSADHRHVTLRAIVTVEYG